MRKNEMNRNILRGRIIKEWKTLDTGRVNEVVSVDHNNYIICPIID